MFGYLGVWVFSCIGVLQFGQTTKDPDAQNLYFNFSTPLNSR